MQMSCIEFTQECCLFNTLQKVLQSWADQCHAITERVFYFVLLERRFEEFILGSPVDWFFLSYDLLQNRLSCWCSRFRADLEKLFIHISRGAPFGVHDEPRIGMMLDGLEWIGLIVGYWCFHWWMDLHSGTGLDGGKKGFTCNSYHLHKLRSQSCPDQRHRDTWEM